MSFLDKAGISARGMLEFFQKLAGQELLPADRQAEYVRTHPLTQDRIDDVQDISIIRRSRMRSSTRNFTRCMNA